MGGDGGLGPQVPDRSLAAMPGLAIFVVSLGFNLLGDGLRDVLDPKGGS
jgi:ABC-type dipeptide/oligopeptide/nickel transport system permease subunit